MRIIGHMLQKAAGEITWLDKAVIRQRAACGIGGEFRIEKAEMRWNSQPQVSQRRSLRHIMEIHLPCAAACLQPAEDGCQEERMRDRCVVHLPTALAGVSKQSVRPGLARCRGEP